MPQPDVSDVHVNAPLTQVSVGYQPGGFFATRAFPVINVDKQTDIYVTYDKSHFARDMGGPGAAPTGSHGMWRAPGTRARVAGYTVNMDQTYRCKNYALGFEISDELRGNADSVFNLDRDAVLLLTSLLNLRYDREFTADHLATSKWADQTITNKWSDYAASTPIEDLREAWDTIRKGTLSMSVDGGCHLLIGSLVSRRLLDHPDLLERIKYGGANTSPAQVSLEMLAQIVGIDDVRVGYSVYTSDEEGTAEASVTYSNVFEDDALLYWTPRGSNQLAPSAGFLFNWRPLTGGGLYFVRKGRNEREKYDWIEVHSYLDWKLVTKDSGVYMDDACD